MSQRTLDQRMLGVGTALTDHTITASDVISFADVGASNAIKRDTVQGVLDLASGGKVLQVVHTSLTAATFSTTSTSFTDITGMTVAITPAATSSKVLLEVIINYDMGSTTSFAAFKALRDSTDLAVGASASSRVQCAAWGSSYDNQSITHRSMTFLDSPSSTSSLTYKMQVNLDGSTFYLNRAATDTNNTSFGRVISTMTATEIGA